MLGRVVATPGAFDVAAETGVAMADLLDRHVRGDWGEMDAHDRRANDRAVRDGGRIFSSYGTGAQRLWVITEADRSSTTVLRPEDY
jgi:hypothetical protein